MKDQSIIADHVSAKWQGNIVLNDISFTINSGENLLVTGGSGSGKTMLAKTIAGQLFHTGALTFFAGGRPSNPAIIFVQRHYHFKNLSNVRGFYYQQRFNSFDGDDAQTVKQELLQLTNRTEAAIDELLKQFDLVHCANEPLLHLSSGEHKRFQLVKALLKDPDIILFDEPFTGLDVQTRAILKNIMNELSARGVLLIMIGSPADAPECITQVLELSKGSVKQLTSKAAYRLIENVRPVHVAKSPVREVKAGFTNAVLFNRVSVSYGDKQVLKDIDWQVVQGEKWLVKGRNGAGKSTLLSLITGDNPQAYANDIYLFDKKRGSGESIWDIKKQIGYVSPELQWYFDTDITCFNAVASGFFDTIGLFRPLSALQQQQVNEWLEYFGLEKNAGRLLSLLPAGRQRLVLLARAMVKNPPVLILDEPCQGLDDQQKEHFIQFTDAICSSADRTLIYVSHYAAEIPSCITKVLELEAGHAAIHSYATSKNLFQAFHT